MKTTLCIFCGMLFFFFLSPTFVLVKSEVTIIETKNVDIDAGVWYPLLHKERYVVSNDDTDELVWYLEFMDDGDEIFARVCCMNSTNNTNRHYAIPEVVKALRLDKTEKYYPFNPPAPCFLEVSPTGKYFLVKLFANISYLYDSDSGKLVDLFSTLSKKTDEVILGFNRQGDVYCGVQGINPMIVLRSISSGKMIKEYTFKGINFPPSNDGLIKSLVKSNDINELGIIYNYQPAPIESPDGKYTVFTFTVFQLRCLFAIVLVGDNEKGTIITKHIVDTSDWDNANPTFVFNKASDKLLFQDGRKVVRMLDMNKEHVTSVFVVPKQLRNNKRSAATNVIDSFFFIPSGDVIVSMRMPRGGYLDSGVESPPEKPLEMSYLWNHKNESITNPRWQIAGAYNIKYWISPDERTVACHHIFYDPKNFTITNRQICQDVISFWDIKTDKLLHTFRGHFVSVSISPNWHKMNITKFENTPKTDEKNNKAKKITYNITKINNQHSLSRIDDFSFWTTATKQKIEAQFIKLASNNVILKNRNGQEISIPIESLSEQDQQYIKILTKQSTDANPAAPNPQSNTFYDYRQWVTINGKRRVRARVISIDVDKDNKKIITLEDEQTKEKIQTFFDQLHDIDQKYMHEIDKKIKAEKSKEK